MKYSILQISDIHKMKDTNYNSLLQTLITDRDKYVEEGVLPPKYIVVCGDLIQGGKNEDEINEQYTEVEGFLNELVNCFLDGDKRHIIMVPGNHDVNRPVTQRSMRIENLPVDPQEKARIIKEMFSPKNGLRWNWNDLNLYSIKDESQYEHRFDSFKNFYNRFYDCIGDRRFPDDSIKNAFIIKFKEDRLAFACFNSCNFLDHLNFAGNIDEDSVASVSNELRDLYNHGYLNIGVWHHHFYGDPYETNYMNRSVFASMAMQDYIKIGLYGHQHRVEVAEEYTSRLFFDDNMRNENKLLLISSGTLFGGDKTLPKGTQRQYNVIEIDNNAGDVNVSINIREDINPGVDSKMPMWNPHLIRYDDNNKIRIKVICKAYTIDNIIRDIDDETRNNDTYEDGCIKLRPFLSNKLAKQFYDEYLGRCDARFIMEEVNNPTTPEECILLLGAILQKNEVEVGRAISSNVNVIQIAGRDPMVKELLSQVNDMLSIH